MSIVNSFYVSVCWYIDGLLNDLIAMFRNLDKLVQGKQIDGVQLAFKKAVLFHVKIIGYAFGR